ncbi:MAG: 23S rRNA (adenine(2503)-C(2))-methyltransferase RlmN [Dehalococcoidales bacterium]|nr:23S rRNA (adenine(2503)-C(2))-methyltransferase RlmN [Dehalococcoidales bacterium]
MGIEKQRILDISYDQVKDLIVEMEERPYRADQLLKWIFKKSAASYEEMSDLPQEFRRKLEDNTVLFTLTPLEERVSADGTTRKMLFQLDDEKTVESALMFYEPARSRRERRTVCISTQVGCPVGCYFCATGQQGFERNLHPGEILEQVLYFIRFIKNNVPTEDHELSRKAITNVVFMGMGEPLANYDNVRQAVITLNSKHGLELGARQITLSTAGLVPQIRRLTGESLHLELAISLHAANDNLRDRLMPINKKYPLAQLIPACREYLEKTGRRPIFEYALFKGINDSPQDSRELADLLKGMNCAVNIIVGNPTSCQEFQSSSLEQALVFQKQLFALGIFNTIRVSRGTDIEAGCGQLRSRWVRRGSKGKEGID